MEAKTVSQSRSIMTEIIFPKDTNYHGTVFGGMMMQCIDKIATIACMRHCRKGVVTASSDSLDFLAPVRLGESLQIEAFVTWTHRSSMEVYVKATAENLLTGEIRNTATSFLTFVAVDEDGRPVPVPPIIPETEEEKRLHETAPARYEARKRRKVQAGT
ncbi:acyl-CoA hydrolase-like protein [Paenibacillus larvae subsp. larvae]|uniref:Acyl-CoA hydrolase-like protein n=2 Tax=Paenibacillus larvae TaxID=1464 RepID=A0A2L1TZI7_9BACL|nr:acyl-CoA thioesterase [Paenibacillus larvae]AQT86479.1 acyl-CoA thioesterase [Paenibacillus larvae subsp. pulvifaciens]AQZ48134.1 acyl-CoA thioesterase [Paenibacillus larvae subsp. pulvifaciens]ARF66788.1 acyl-CoA thioesterase [Paenibacillus larvae subsp. pulvifaciens]AVF26086.1 acyl-CoA hydrolase-like protein [Paenibacillus larvae subsp. larvae]AVF30864.1 acyl-CoA hydrolase-like protein [Paenibacillus larvae subsp. larvae]